MRIKNIAILCLLGFSFSNYAQSKVIHTYCEEDTYAKINTCKTDYLSIKIPNGFLTRTYASAKLNSYFSIDSGIETVSLVVEYTSPDWAFFSSALDSDGKELKFREIAHTIESSGISEHFAVNFDRAYILKHINDGLDIKFYGKNDQIIAKVPPEYIQSLLNKTQENNPINQEASASSSSNPVKLGVDYLPVSKEVTEYLMMKEPAGVLVMKVVKDSVADKAGIKLGDVILSINHKPVSMTMTGLQDTMKQFKAGDPTEIRLWRNGKSKTININF